MRKIFFLLLSCVLLTTAFADGQDLYSFATPLDTQRYQALVKEIRCVVCQGQNIADSNAPLAYDLRNKVYEMINEKKSDQEIKTYLVKRYGEFILYNPRINKLTILLWAFPFLAAGLALAMLFSPWRNRRRVI